MAYDQGVGFIDGQAMIEMNNLAVGYFPSGNLEIGVYPPPVPEQPPVLPLRQPVQPGQDSKTNS